MATAATRSFLIDEDQGATFVELFFDLVFVFAITQVTGLVHHDLTPAGIANAVLVFWMIWWGWTQFTWALNPVNTEHATVRLWTLAATGVAFIMAINVGDAFGDSGLLFAGAYVVCRLIGLGIYYNGAREQAELAAAVRYFMMLSMGGLVLAVIGGLLAPEIRAWVWLAAVLLDMAAAVRASRYGGWGLYPGHFAERHGLFVIIALGESLVAAGVAASHQEMSTPLMMVALGAVAVACLLWWSYFGWLMEYLEEALHKRQGAEQSILARNAYSLLHFPLIGGVIAVAVGIEAMVAHPSEALEFGPLAAFAVGIILFVGAGAAAWRVAGGAILWWRIGFLVSAIAALLLPNPTPLWVLGITTAALLGVLLREFARCHHTGEHAAT
jgi:low temperature requirement protein LtrA